MPYLAGTKLCRIRIFRDICFIALYRRGGNCSTWNKPFGPLAKEYGFRFRLVFYCCLKVGELTKSASGYPGNVFGIRLCELVLRY